MASSSMPVLLANLKNIIPGTAKFLTAAPASIATLKKIKDRQWNHGPEDIKNQCEVYETYFWKRHLDQRNMWIDKDLKTEVTRKELADLQRFKIDSWRAGHCLALPVGVFGGFAAPWLVAWMGSYNHMLSTVPQTADEKKTYYEQQDLYRYKYVQPYRVYWKWMLEMHIDIPEKYHAGWEEIFQKNDVRRDPAVIRQTDEFMEHYQKFSLLSRKQIRAIARAMNFPTYPTFGKICLQKRVADYWELAWNEDYIVLTTPNALADLSDDDLFDYAWRRFLTPYDKNLTREQVLDRVADYHKFLGPDFVSEGKQPNLFQTIGYVFGYYDEPGYLENDFAELEQNDYEHLSYWAKDTFVKRLEFENGPLRDQVEAHVQKKLAEREKTMKNVEEEIKRIQQGNAATEKTA